MQNQSMKGLRQVVIDSSAGSLLVAASFLVAEVWIPMAGDTDVWGQNHVVNIDAKGASTKAAKNAGRSLFVSFLC